MFSRMSCKAPSPWGGVHDVSLGGQDVAKELDDLGLIVDDQDALTRHPLNLSCRNREHDLPEDVPGLEARVGLPDALEGEHGVHDGREAPARHEVETLASSWPEPSVDPRIDRLLKNTRRKSVRISCPDVEPHVTYRPPRPRHRKLFSKVAAPTWSRTTSAPALPAHLFASATKSWLR
jgi:hypothetical protein